MRQSIYAGLKYERSSRATLTGIARSERPGIPQSSGTTLVTWASVAADHAKVMLSERISTY